MSNQTPLGQIYALDIETACNVPECPGTTCKHALIPHLARITVVGVCNQGFKHAFWKLEDLAAWLLQNPSAKFVCHNGQFDFKHLLQKEMPLNIDQWAADTYLMSALRKDQIPNTWLANYEEKRKQINKTLPVGKRHRNAGKLSLKTLAPYWLSDVEPFWEAVEDYANEDYVLKDAAYTFDLYLLLSSVLVEEGVDQFFYKYQMPWARAMFQLGGVQLNLEGLKKLEEEQKKKVESLRAELQTLWHYGAEALYDLRKQKLRDKYYEMSRKAITKKFGRPTKENADAAQKIQDKYDKLFNKALLKVPKELNIDSATQMLWLFREFYQWNVKSLDGTTSTGKTLLQKRADEGHEDAKLFLQYKKARKLISSFIEPYKELQLSGRLYPSFNSFGARTGRTSCQNPNLQQCPPEIRRLIEAPPGHKLIIYDMSAIEPRLIAYFSEDPALVDLFQRKGDFHGLNAIKYGLVPQDAIEAEVKHQYPTERKVAKEGGLSNLYGAGKVRTKLIFQKYGYDYSLEQCDDFIKRLRAGYKGVTAYKRHLDKQAEMGKPTLSIFGQPVYYPNPDDIYMQNFNTQIQGSASQLVVQAVRNLIEIFNVRKMKSRPVLAVHDEIVVLSPDDEVDVAKGLVIQQMTKYNLKTKHGPVPLEVEGKVSQIWEK